MSTVNYHATVKDEAGRKEEFNLSVLEGWTQKEVLAAVNVWLMLLCFVS